MKTLLYNPIFINPLAYYVFPNLSRVQTLEVDSTKEPANYIGTIDITTIAYGDIGKVETFTNTNYIDLINFSNSWVRISLHTRIGSVVLGEWKLGNFEKEEPEEPPYIEPDVLASLCGVWIADQNTNESPNRNIIKNKLRDRGGDFEILNAAYKLNSGYGKYAADFTSWSKAHNNKLDFKDYYFKVTSASDFNSYGYVIWRIAAIDGFKIKVSGFPKGKKLIYTTFNEAGQQQTIIDKDGVYKLPASIDNTSIGFGFSIINQSPDDFIGLKVEQIPEYNGAVITDGVDDLIVSQKPVEEMLSDGRSITVISMIHLLPDEASDVHYTNYVLGRSSGNLIKVKVFGNNKTGIYGYSTSGHYNSYINHVLLGDKEDYDEFYFGNDNYDKFSVEGYLDLNLVSKVAWYWTFIANKILNEEQINQIIEYFNLDKYVVPDVLYNVKRQGLTNDNHAEFGDKLIDYSGNAHDMQLYNIGWEGTSGVNSYPVIFGGNKTYKTLIGTNDGGIKYTVSNTKFNITMIHTNRAINYNYVKYAGSMEGNQINNVEVPEYRIKVTGLVGNIDIRFKYIKTEGATVVSVLDISEDGIYTIPKSFKATSNIEAETEWVGFQLLEKQDLGDCNITIEVLPEYDGALVLDGVNDYGKVTNLPIYKDYTVVADYQRLIDNHDRVGGDGSLLSKSYTPNQGAFVFNAKSETMDTGSVSYSFGSTTYNPNVEDMIRNIFYQTKYKNQDFNINAGTGVDGDSMVLGTFRDKDSRLASIALYSAMLFPYSLSKFLIERQLKRHKLDDLYKDKILLRPIIHSNALDVIESVTYAKSDIPAYEGEWLDKDNIQWLKVIVNLNNRIDEIAKVTLNGTEGIPEQNGKIFTFKGANFKSPQVIDITITLYVRFEEIPQYYPVFVTYQDLEGREYSWGDKIDINLQIKIASLTNLLPNLYKITGYRTFVVDKGGKDLTEEEFLNSILDLRGILENLEVHSYKKYLLGDNEPHSILSPEIHRIPNESYRFMLYIPDISGNYGPGYIFNSAYDETSGAIEDGSFKLDGIEDFIRIYSDSPSAKQVFMKTKWNKTSALLYDLCYFEKSRLSIFTTSEDDTVNNRIAYMARDPNSQTYIDGIYNQYVETHTLQNVIHNIVITNDELGTTDPTIGSDSYGTKYHSDMSLYTVMIFHEVSTPELIRELNEIIGINPIIETPPYYYDTYGKSNEEENKAELTNLGNGGEHTLNIQNVGYEGMSGYGGFPVVFGVNKTWYYLVPKSDKFDYNISSNVIIIRKANNSSAMMYNMIKDNEGTSVINNVEIPSFKIKVNGIEASNGVLRYRYLATEDAAETSILTILEDGTYQLPRSYKGTDNIISNAYVGLYFGNPFEGNATIEVLPDYPNGLLLDGVNDMIRNTTIPALTDFTCIVKREMIGEQINGSSFMNKGQNTTTGGTKNAFMYDYKTASGKYIYSFSNANKVDTANLISYITPISADGQNITKGTGGDDVGLMIGKWDTWWKGVFYKLMLYPKTLDMLQINMLKNLFELDGVWYFKDGSSPKLYGDVDFTKFKVFPLSVDKISITFTQTSMHITKISVVQYGKLISIDVPTRTPLNSYKVRVSNLPPEVYLNYTYVISKDSGRHFTLKNGINIIPRTSPMFTSNFGIREGFSFGGNTTGTFDVDILIELI